MPAISQPSFTTGELTPSLYGRVDLARFYTALKTCRNFIVRPFGGVMNRAGTGFCTEVKDSTKKVRLIEFIFSSTQSYVLEVGPQYIRFITNGGYVLDGGVPVEITTPYLEDDLALIKYVQSADVMTLCRQTFKQRQLNRFSHTSWTLTDFDNTGGPFLDINTDTAKTVRTSNNVGNVTITANSAIFSNADIGRLFYIEQNPNANVRRWEVQKSVQINEIRRAGSSYYRAITAGTTGTVRPSVLEGYENDGDPGVAWEYIHSGYGIVKITGYTSATVVTGTVVSRLPDSVVGGAQTRNISGAQAFDPDATPGTGDEYVWVTCNGHGFSNGDVVTISGVVGMTILNNTWTISVIDSNRFRVNVDVTGQTYTSGGVATRTLTAVETYKWALEAWGGNQKYPTTAVYYQQRQVFGGTVGLPHTAWMSKSGGSLDFGQSVPLLDDDAITFALKSEMANEIRHFIRMKSLIALTSEAAWIIQKEQGNLVPITDPQDQGGASHVRPLKIGKKAIYVEDKGGAIRSLGYEFSSDTYEGQDLTLTASHLFFGKTIVDWAYQKVPFRCVWIVLDDGGLVGLTYLPDQEVVGWHRHDTDGLFESVCCVPEGSEDAVYVVVKRQINGVWKRYVERFNSRFFTKIEDAFFVDSGLSYDGRTVAANVVYTLSGGTDWTYQETLTFTTTTDFFVGISDVNDEIVLYDATGQALRLKIIEYVSTKIVKVLASRTVPEEFRGIQKTGFQMARDSFSGLGHLEGKTVSVFADGNVHGEKVVTSGSIQLETPAVVVHVGLPFDSDFETLDVNIQGQSIQDKKKNVRSVTLLVEKTRGLRVGPDPNNLLDVLPVPSGEYDKPISEVTGQMECNIISDWSTGGRVFVRQSDPLPVTILAAIPDVAIGG